jgi:hypothetical protein
MCAFKGRGVGDATCLTLTALNAFTRLSQAEKIQAEWTKQGDQRLEAEKQLFRLSCNHQNVIPHWTQWWQWGGQRGVRGVLVSCLSSKTRSTPLDL